jgi:hypothetical protein
MRRRIDRPPFRFPFRVHRSAFIACFLAFLFSLSICVAFGNAQEKPKQKLQEWQINGILAALDDGYSGVKQKAFEKLVEFDAEHLKAFSKQSEEIGKRAIDLAKNAQEGSKLRYKAVLALGSLGETDPSIVEVLCNWVKNVEQDSNLRLDAAYALGNLSKADASAVSILSDVLKNPKENAYLRSIAAGTLVNWSKNDTNLIQFLSNLVTNSKEDFYLRISVAEELKKLGKANPTVMKTLSGLREKVKQEGGLRIRPTAKSEQLNNSQMSIVRVLSDIVTSSKEDPVSANLAAYALDHLSGANSKVVQALSNAIKSPKQDLSLRIRATFALGEIQPLDLSQIFVFINHTHATAYEDFNNSRFAAYYYGRGETDIRILMRWIGRPDVFPDAEKLTDNDRRNALKVFQKAWEPSRDFPNPRAELARAIASVTSKGNWRTSDAALLEQHYKNLSSNKFSEADTVKAAIDSLIVWKSINQFRNIVAAHLAFWVGLIFLYPKYAWIQAIFFWNPWVRKIGGAGYVGFLLAWVPFLRRKLFEPFRDSLLADAKLHSFNPDAYFPNSEVTLKDANQPQPLPTVFPEIKGQSILEGDSGLGKTLFLRHLVKASPRIVVYLPAEKCEKGVIEAIQAKLHGQAQDADFLRNLIYSGAIDICIDGLNEVSADTRATISDFVERYFKGNILMTTQPIEWSPPSTAKTYVLQPLRPDQIKTFLISRQTVMPVCATYAQDCDRYLDAALSPNQSTEEYIAAQRILSNPMDLTIVAQMLAQGRTPDLFRLQEQQYTLMANEYRQIYSSEFPLKPFSEAVYQRRLNDEPALPADEFYNELICMEDDKHKMVISRQWKDPKGEIQKEWYFRHDKIAEFFIVQTFLGDSETAKSRMYEHLGDPRFRGVYFLLATFLSIDAAQALRETLIQYAADTKDHTVSDTFVQLLRTRKA